MNHTLWLQSVDLAKQKRDFDRLVAVSDPIIFRKAMIDVLPFCIQHLAQRFAVGIERAKDGALKPSKNRLIIVQMTGQLFNKFHCKWIIAGNTANHQRTVTFISDGHGLK